MVMSDYHIVYACLDVTAHVPLLHHVAFKISWDTCLECRECLWKHSYAECPHFVLLPWLQRVVLLPWPLHIIAVFSCLTVIAIFWHIFLVWRVCSNIITVTHSACVNILWLLFTFMFMVLYEFCFSFVLFQTLAVVLWFVMYKKSCRILLSIYHTHIFHSTLALNRAICLSFCYSLRNLLGSSGIGFHFIIWI